MRDRPLEPRSRNRLPSDVVPPKAETGAANLALPGDGITPVYLARSVRENLPLFALIVGIALAATALLLVQAEPRYSARSVIRMASERRTLTNGVESAPQSLDRPVDPLLSAVQVLTSRTLVGAVVDSLGLRLRPASPFILGAPAIGRRISTGTFRDVKVAAAALSDTFALRFSDEGVIARSRGGEAYADFGQPLRLGSVGLTVPARPAVGYAIVVLASRDEAIDEVLQRLKVVPRPGTDVIDVKYADADPVRAQQFANQLAQLFQAANGHSAQGQAGRRREFLGEQLRVTDSMLMVAEAGLSSFRGRQQMGSSSDNLIAEQATAASRQARHGELVGDRRVLAALLDRLKGDPDAAFQALAYSPEVASDTTLSQLQQRLIAYRGKLDSLTTGPWRALATHPDVVQLTTLLETTQDQLIRAVRARLASIDARIAVLSSQQASGQKSIKGLPAQQAAEATLDRRVQVLRTTADALRQEYQKARISEALSAADIEIMDLAPVPYRTSGVPRSASLLFGLLLGVLFGGGAAVVADVTNSSVRRPRELHDLIGANELGIIPRIQGIAAVANGSHRQLLPGASNGSGNGNGHGVSSELLFSPSGALSAEAEAFRMLRIGLAFSWGNQPCTLVVTSAAPQEGKTLIATNLAATFARGGARVLLIDCDIHRPRLHRVFHATRAPGLMDLLRTGGLSSRSTTAMQRATAIRSTPIDRLSFLPCGANPQSTPELLERAPLRALLAQLRPDFDVILLDTPPVLVSADAATLGASADGVIMVVRAGQTDRGAAELARQRVISAGGRVLGAVLNDPDGVLARFGKTYYAYDYPATVD